MTKFYSSRRLKQRGYVLLMMGASSIAVLGASGLALDLGRLYVNKQESQAFVDSAAIAAALELDGTSAGITRAKAVVTGSSNKWNMATASVPSPTVEFATTKTGTYVATPTTPAGYIFARVTVTLPAKLYFLPLVNGKKYSQNVISRAVAAQTQITKFGKGLAPYTAIAQTATGPKFGLTPGSEYTIQWPAINTGNNCKQNNPKGCFVKSPCAGDTDTAMWSVAKELEFQHQRLLGLQQQRRYPRIRVGRQTDPPRKRRRQLILHDGLLYRRHVQRQHGFAGRLPG